MLRILTILSLFILLLPCFQTCSDKNIIENPMLIGKPLEEEVITPTNGEPKFDLTLEELTMKKKKAITDFISLKSKLTNNGYEIGFLFINDLENPSWILLPFTISILINLFLIVLTFGNRYRVIYILSIVNIFLLTIPLIILYIGTIFDDIHQLKIGFYMLLINFWLIALEAKNNKKFR